MVTETTDYYYNDDEDENDRQKDRSLELCIMHAHMICLDTTTKTCCNTLGQTAREEKKPTLHHRHSSSSETSTSTTSMAYGLVSRVSPEKIFSLSF